MVTKVNDIKLATARKVTQFYHKELRSKCRLVQKTWMKNNAKTYIFVINMTTKEHRSRRCLQSVEEIFDDRRYVKKPALPRLDPSASASSVLLSQ